MEFVRHRIAAVDTLDRPPEPGVEYLFAGCGTYVRARRSHLSVLLPVGMHDVPGLPRVTPHFDLDPPRIPAAILGAMVIRAFSAVDASGTPLEVLWHLWWDEDERAWQCEEPDQDATETSVRPRDDGPHSSYQRALVEVHSHHRFPPIFSAADDRDERGFRIYGVIGTLAGRPSLATRVGVFGQFVPIPPEWVFNTEPAVGSARTEELW